MNTKPNTAQATLALLFSILPLLSACGGGGGGGGGNGADTTAPSALLTPAAGTAAVEPSATIYADFDEDMFAATIDSSSFTLSDANGNVAATVSYDALTRNASLLPDAPLALLRDYSAHLSNAITDLHIWGQSKNSWPNGSGND